MVHTIFLSFIPLVIPPRTRLLILGNLCFRCFLEDVSIATHLVAIWEMFPCLDLLGACFLFHMTWVECFRAMLLLDSLCQFQRWLLPLQMHRLISRERYAIFCDIFSSYFQLVFVIYMYPNMSFLNLQADGCLVLNCV